MADYQLNRSWDNEGFTPDDAVVEGSIPVEPAPHRFLPRIIANKNGDISAASPVPPVDTDVATPENEETEDRDTWDNPLEFLLSCISMSVGLGNVWRFPAVAATNGGGAFLIPYLIVLLLIGRPLYYLEMCLGQFSRYGQVKVWNMIPMFKGVGYAAMIGIISVVSYYCYLMAITVRYFFSSFAKNLPWAECDENIHWKINCSEETRYAEYFYKYTVNPQLPNIDSGLGDFNWQLTLCLVFSWILIFLSLVRGVKSSGKVAYFTAIFPYVVLITLLIRGATLPGAWKGVKVFLEPQWSEITKPEVWYAAVSQCFFSLTIGFGPVIMFSSYNGFRQNIYKDALIISFMDTFTSILAGVTIFCVIGNIMERQGLEFNQLEAVEGASLAFILYPQAIATFEWVPQLFAVLFFLMLFTLGIGSATSLTGGVITIICDQFPKWARWQVTLIVCIGGFLLGLMYVTEGGTYMLDLIDNYGSSMVIYWTVMVECSAICYGYGLTNLCNDIEFMCNRTTGIYWRFCWAIVIPFGLLANMIYFLATAETYKSGDVEYPAHATALGWGLTGFALFLVPCLAIHTILTRKQSTLIAKIKQSLKPTERWGPQKPKLRREWQEFRARKDAEGSKRFYFF